MAASDLLELAVGAVVVLVFINDLFQTVVLPRPSSNYLRPSVLFTGLAWRAWRGLARRSPGTQNREMMLGSFGPFMVIGMLGLTVAGLIVGYGLILHALRSQITPQPDGLASAVYFSAVSLLTLGFGDLVPTGGAARILVGLEAATGLGTVALVISLLFSLYAAFQRREVRVITLDALAGAPPSGLTLLERCQELRIPETLIQTFDEWKIWSAEVLESHLAYPVLNYFRSSHDNESWVSALGAVMDAATLVLTTIDGGPVGHAKLMYQVGHHLVEDLSLYFKLPMDDEVGVERAEFDQACERLAAAGYLLRAPDSAWESFSRVRSEYALPLNSLATYFDIPPSQWVGDRTLIQHRLLRHA
jgi:hypothetical protein